LDICIDYLLKTDTSEYLGNKLQTQLVTAVAGHATIQREETESDWNTRNLAHFMRLMILENG